MEKRDGQCEKRGVLQHDRFVSWGFVPERFTCTMRVSLAALSLFFFDFYKKKESKTETLRRNQRLDRFREKLGQWQHTASCLLVLPCIVHVAHHNWLSDTAWKCSWLFGQSLGAARL